MENLVKQLMDAMATDIENMLVASSRRTSCNEELAAMQQAIIFIRLYKKELEKNERFTKKYKEILRR